jgi:hypothetical protein
VRRLLFCRVPLSPFFALAFLVILHLLPPPSFRAFLVRNGLYFTEYFYILIEFAFCSLSLQALLPTRGPSGARPISWDLLLSCRLK